MDGKPTEEVTRLLHEVDEGAAGAEERLWQVVYEDLRRIAHRAMAGERRGITIQTTALVHEAYLRLAGGQMPSLNNRKHLLRVVARAMRQVLVDESRRRVALKRGGDRKRVDLADGAALCDRDLLELAELDDALTRLGQVRPRCLEVVHLRFILGLTVDQAADVLECSSRTVEKDWQFAQSFVRRELSRDA